MEKLFSRFPTGGGWWGIFCISGGEWGTWWIFLEIVCLFCMYFGF
ncbi:hypothetical protein A8806_101328 [Faecalicatena orotica]|uniref:Uncharacterized protein n=1 Tax=Faecalicatena orotica TaxID=1544 RepID=A0A2Y9B8Y4_9FIRM|nr:hypothetical protein A8806_101328 [Faecalicatena orotica]SSA53872.1 hypothetical protein SAMN05216536_101328 [Faecalicatena orotica]